MGVALQAGLSRDATRLNKRWINCTDRLRVLYFMSVKCLARKVCFKMNWFATMVVQTMKLLEKWL